jgi:hypothetical protein
MGITFNKEKETRVMNDETQTKPRRKRWKRILRWTASIIVLVLVLWGFIAYWTSTNDCKRYSAVPANPMKAVVYCEYGVANLKFQDVEKPAPADDQLLVKVRAASVNPLDWHFVEGTPYVMRPLAAGFRKPKDTQLGVDFAGTVEAVGKNVTKFKPGDEVFGGRPRESSSGIEAGRHNVRRSGIGTDCGDYRAASPS